MERDNLQFLQNLTSGISDLDSQSSSIKFQPKLKGMIDRKTLELEEREKFLSCKERDLEVLERELDEKKRLFDHSMTLKMSHEHWDTKMNQLRKEIQSLRKELSSCTQDKNEANKRYEELKDEMVLLKSKNESLKNQLSVTASVDRSERISLGKKEPCGMVELCANVEKLNCEVLDLKVEREKLMEQMLTLKMELAEKGKECSEVQHQSSKQQVSFNSCLFQLGNVKSENRALKNELDQVKKQCEKLRKKVDYLMQCDHNVPEDNYGNLKTRFSTDVIIEKRKGNIDPGVLDTARDSSLKNKLYSENKTRVNLEGVLSELDVSRLDTEVDLLKETLQEKQAQLRLKKQMRQKMFHNY